MIEPIMLERILDDREYRKRRWCSIPSRCRVTTLQFSQPVVNAGSIQHKRPRYLTRNAKFSLGYHYMRSKRNNSIHNSSEFITFRAYFGIPVEDSALPEPSTTIASDFGNGTVWQNAWISWETAQHERKISSKFFVCNKSSAEFRSTWAAPGSQPPSFTVW